MKIRRKPEKRDRPEMKERYPVKSFRRKPAPPDQQNAENFYYLKQINTKTPMVFVLFDGETINGYIDWYDKNSIKVNREKEPNLIIMKKTIKYMFKREELLAVKDVKEGRRSSP